jgi:hypothetical protein
MFDIMELHYNDYSGVDLTIPIYGDTQYILMKRIFILDCRGLAIINPKDITIVGVDDA